MMQAQVEDLQRLASEFLQKLFTQLEANHIVIEKHWHIDHLCYRCSTRDIYHSLKNALSQKHALLIESDVNGRPISTFKLSNAVRYRDWSIDLIELPAPKASKPCLDGFEHIEIVCDIPFQSIKDRYPKLRFDEGGLKKSFNQELEICLDGCAIKFHHASLESIIEIEKNSTVFNALQKSKVLEILKPFNPLVAGTFPLGLQTKDSDLDILVSSSDLSRLASLIRERFESFPGFKTKSLFVEGKESIVTQFMVDQIPIEIFAQQTPSISQTAYKHFLIEEKLLKLGGLAFKNEVLQLRKNGLKTEPAFAMALGLEGDPYLALLELQTKNETELAAMVAHHLKTTHAR